MNIKLLSILQCILNQVKSNIINGMIFMGNDLHYTHPKSLHTSMRYNSIYAWKSMISDKVSGAVSMIPLV